MDDLFPIEINGGFHENNTEHLSEDEFDAVCMRDRHKVGF